MPRQPSQSAPRERFRVVQCRIAEIAAGPANPASAAELRALLVEERDLLRDYGPAWELPIRDALPGILRVQFRNGEIDQLAIDASAFPLAAERIERVAPTVTGVTLVAHRPVSDALLRYTFARPELARLALLRFVGPWGNHVATAVAGCRFLTNAAQLDFSEIGLGAAGLRALVTTDALPALTELDLSFNPLGSDAAVALALIDTLPPKLAVLRLCDAQLHDGAAHFLANVSAFNTLKELWLTGNPLSADALTELRCAFPCVEIVADAGEVDHLQEA
ncbi:MAG: hypothetical protein FJ304_22040 [Planctomycetes bacterium]|nr:hypothetical protein [Planctomycetota bacterium]